jgi:aerobic carbon-monoxide dehydrogenase large subunit
MRRRPKSAKIGQAMGGTMASVNSWIGAPIERREDLRFLRGAGTYVGDLKREAVLHGVVLRSSVAHGRLDAVDASRALAMPGVVAVLTAAELPSPMPRIPMRAEPHPEYRPFYQPVIAHRKVRYVGEPIALVVAESPALAEDALDAIEVEIAPLPPVLDGAAALAGGVLLFEEAASNRPAMLQGVKGDADAVFATAPYRRKERFRTHRHSAVPMEMRGLLAEWDAGQGQLTLHGAAKVPFHNRDLLAQLLGLATDKVLLIEHDVGGGFGVRGEFYPEDFLVPFAAMRLGRPVRWAEDRRENLLATNHSREAECELEIACDETGRILALRGTSFVNCGAYLRTTGSTPARNIAQVLSGPYRIEHIKSDVSLLVSNKTPSGTYRGPGRFESDFFRERLLDMVAADFGQDRVAFRRRNLVPEAEMPWPMASVGSIKSECDSGDYRMTLDRCLAEFGWTDKEKLSGRAIEGRFHGIAVGCYLEGAASGKEGARLTLEADGSVTVGIGSSAIGQGLETVMAQIAADALSLPIDRIRPVRHGSTNLVRDGGGAFSSRSVVMGGSALMDAAGKLKDAIRAAAARRLGCTAEEIQLLDGKAVGPGRQALDFGSFAGEIAPVDGAFSTPKRTYSYGAHAAHVAVDPRTGGIAVLDYVAVEDVGRIINPHTLHGQCLGAIVQGLGGTLLEHLVYDETGQMLAGSFADYLLPTAGDFPRIHVVALEEKPSPVNPLGAKGAGEGGIIPVGGVIANAVADALKSFGVQPHALPLTPPKVWAMIEEARKQ